MAKRAVWAEIDLAAIEHNIKEIKKCIHVDAVPHTAIAHLAAESGVGEATITRFVKKMGFSSLQAFKLALARELTETSHRYIINNNIEAGETALETGRKLLDVNIGTLEKTLAALDEGVIERCAELMRQAKRLQFIGLGNSGFIALDSAYKFYRIGMESTGLDNGHSMQQNFFKDINIRPENIHIPDGMAADVKAEGHRYDALIDARGGIDLQVLGIGANAHIGFNEPDIKFEATTHRVKLDEETIRANSRFFKNMDEVPRYAISMGIKTIMSFHSGIRL